MAAVTVAVAPVATVAAALPKWTRAVAPVLAKWALDVALAVAR